ncbi:MAG TPA: SDR family oxidoreductase [Thermoanaerobaculia bacterium]|nr:SDR family oxidoreductase [Thermoanaerobaculia bacterium]
MTTATSPDRVSMTGQRVLITGANTGIGKWTAIGLAQRGAAVAIHSRNPEKGRAAQEEIRRHSGAADVDLLLADFSSLAEVRRLAAEVLERYPRLDVLVNNAGLISGRRAESADGYELTFAVNHLAPFLLTNLLLDRIVASAPARIVTVSSRAHLRAAIDFDDLDVSHGYQAMDAYGRSKLANVLFTRELARRLEGTGVTANCLHPGVVRSDFGSSGDLGGIMGAGWAVMQPFLLSPKQGADTSIHLASSPDVAAISGEYFDRRRVARTSTRARDMAAAERLWRISAERVGLS